MSATGTERPQPARSEDGLLVRRAEDREARAGRLLMPETYGPQQAPDLWVAIDTETALIVGAAALSWRPAFDPAGLPLQIHVPPPLRRRGIGRALAAAVANAVRGSTPRLHSWFGIGDDGPAAFLAAIGFTPTRRMLEYEADVQHFYGMVKALRDRLSASGRMPPGFRVVPLREAPPDEVARLVADNFRDAPPVAIGGIARGHGGHDADKSVVLLDGETVRGALLYKWNDGLPTIEARVVAPEARGSAANLLMLEAATRNGMEGGAERFRFSCNDDMRDTIKLAQRGGAALLAAKSRYTRVLAG